LKSPGYPVWVVLLVPFFVFLHQGSWFWSDARLVGGLPVNLLFHSVLSLFFSAVMLLVVRFAWPDYLDRD
jgi:hypothetical protein